MFNEAKKITKAQKEVIVAKEAMQRDLRDKSLQHFNKSFDDEGFTYNALFKWAPRKREKPGRHRKILSGETKRLKNSLYGRAKSTKNTFTVVVKSKSKYAQIHNEGLNGLAFGKHPFKMPKRMFVGYSRVLDIKLKKIFDSRIRKIFK